jgi:hypothetical protein
MNLNTKLISKDEKRKTILDYAKNIYNNENRFVSKREIRKAFHVELYNYFKNVFEMYQNLEIDVPLCFCPRDYAKKKIIEYVRDKAKNGVYLGGRELENNLGISMRSYFGKAENLYCLAKVDYNLHIQQVKQSRFHSIDKIKEQRERIIYYIKKRNRLGYFAGVCEIQHNLKLNFYKYFLSPEEAYKEAGIDYQRICPIILGKKKEKILTEIALHLLVEMGYTIKRTSIFDRKNFNRGPDIEVLDKEGEKVLVEIKAYHKRYWITTREIKQLQEYMEKKNVSKGIFITTSDKVNHNPKNIEIINGKKLINFLKSTYLEKYIEKVKWVQEEKVNTLKTKRIKEKIRRKVVNCVIKNSQIMFFREVEKILKIDKRTYFKNISSSELLKIIRKNSNSGNDLLCKDPQQALLNTSLVQE